MKDVDERIFPRSIDARKRDGHWRAAIGRGRHHNGVGRCRVEGDAEAFRNPGLLVRGATVIQNGQGHGGLPRLDERAVDAVGQLGSGDGRIEGIIVAGYWAIERLTAATASLPSCKLFRSVNRGPRFEGRAVVRDPELCTPASDDTTGYSHGPVLSDEAIDGTEGLGVVEMVAE